jgi:sodium transport system permease protein
MKSDLITIIKKEFARFFGDKRMVLTAILPGILIYMMYTFMGSGMSEMQEVDDDYLYEINVVNMPQTFAFLEEVEGVEIIKLDAKDEDSVKDSIREDVADILVVFPENFDAEMLSFDVMTATTPAPNVEIYYNSASTESSSAYGMMIEILNSFEQSLVNKFDICQGEKEYDLATDEDVSAMVLSMMMPMLVMMMLFTGCLSAAAESIAGEKERGTIATLLVTPMKRRDLAMGKMISLSAIGLISGTSSFLGIMLSLPNLMGGSGLEEVKFGYTAVDYGVLLMVILTTTFLIVGMISIISAFAKSVKEATTMATPLMIVVSLIGLTNMMSAGMPEEWFWYLIPVYNTAQCLYGVFSMDYQMVPVVITCVINLLYSGVLVALLSKMFDSERIMYT